MQFWFLDTKLLKKMSGFVLRIGLKVEWTSFVYIKTTGNR